MKFTSNHHTVTHTVNYTITIPFITTIMIRELRRTSGWLRLGVFSHEGKTSGLVLSLLKIFRQALEREREREREK